MDKITEMYATDCKESNYIKPFRLHYKQNDKAKTWDVIKVHSSVSIIIFNVSRKVLVMVRQFRPAVYYSYVSEEDKKRPIDSARYPGRLGLTLELCAGIVDKPDLPLEEIAREEVLEECGYDIPVSALKKIFAFRSSVGLSGERQTMYYAEVTDNQRVSKGGGNPNEGELIEVVEMTIPQIRDYLQSDEPASPTGFFFGMSWFLNTKASKFEPWERNMNDSH